MIKTTHIERRGFTLIELLVVIAIIGMLAGLILPAIAYSRETARQANCKNNLHQISVALTMYRDDNKRFPDWLSNLYARYLNSNSLVYLCKSDQTMVNGVLAPGKGPLACKPDGFGEMYPEASDNDSNANPKRDPNLHACSYLYELNAAPCSWAETTRSWAEVKEEQLATGNNGGPFDPSYFPVVRCFHHARARRVPALSEIGGTVADSTGAMTLNVSHAGNIFVAPLEWELTPPNSK